MKRFEVSGLVFLVFVLSLFAGSSACAQPGNSREIMLIGSGKEDGSMTEFMVSRRSVEQSPAWNPEIDEPPLSIPRAVALAKEQFLLAHPKFDGARFRGLNLMPIHDLESPNRWFFMITFSPIIDGEAMFSNHDPVVMLVDGTLAQGRQSERPIRD